MTLDPHPLAGSLRGLVAAAALCVLLVAPHAPAQEDPKPGPEQRAAALNKRFAEVEATAAKLNQDYRAALEERVRELARSSQTLLRLHEVGIFTVDALLAGLPKDQIPRLPFMRRALETVDVRAKELEGEFGRTAREKNEQVALSVVRRIASSQRIFRNEDRDGNGILDYATDLADLSRTRLFEKGAKNGFTANGYVFEIVHGDVLTYAATAKPERVGDTGDMYYFVDETGIVRVEKRRPAGKQSTPIEE